jgi:chemotaxis family two-component system sensor kinase Cph1
MRAATGFDRAMVYRFLPDDSGEVVAEDARSGLESFLGLHYPASDIPKQARELYRRNWLRAIPDVDYRAAPLRPEINPRTGHARRYEPLHSAKRLADSSRVLAQHGRERFAVSLDRVQ